MLVLNKIALMERFDQDDFKTLYVGIKLCFWVNHQLTIPNFKTLYVGIKRI